MNEQATPKYGMAKSWSNLLILILGIVFIIGAYFLHKSTRVKTTTVSEAAGMKAMAYSLGLDGAGVRHANWSEVKNFWLGSDIVLGNGFCNGAFELWPQLAPRKTEMKDSKVIWPELGLGKVKIIPSGGLFPYYRTGSFGKEIADFVQKGGVLIVFGQPLGAMYKVLPGQPQGYGWEETQGTNWLSTEEVYVTAVNPIVSGVLLSKFKAHVGGFFTELPKSEDMRVILKSAVTGAPVLMTYTFGAGRIIATTLVSDAASYFAVLDEDEKTLMRDLLNWAKANASDLNTYDVNETAALTLTVPAGEKCSTGRYELIDPNGNVHSSSSFELSSEDATIFSFALPLADLPRRGIWLVKSYRYLNNEQAGPAHFMPLAVGRPETEDPDGIYAAITVPGTKLPVNSTAPVVVHLWNKNSSSQEVTYKGPAGKKTLTLSAGQYWKRTETLPEAIAAKKTFTYEFYNHAGVKIAEIKRTITGGQPDRVFLSIVCDPTKAYRAGDAVGFKLRSLSIFPGVYKAQCMVTVALDGKNIWQEQLTMDLNGSYSVEKDCSFRLPADVQPGIANINATLTYEKWTVAQGQGRLTIK